MNESNCKECGDPVGKTDLKCAACGATHYNATVTMKHLGKCSLQFALLIPLAVGVTVLKPHIAEFANDAYVRVVAPSQAVALGRQMLIETDEDLDDRLYVAASKILWSGINDKGNKAYIIKYAYKAQEDYADAFMQFSHVGYEVLGDDASYRVVPGFLETDQSMAFYLAEVVGVDVDLITPAHAFYKIDSAAIDF